MKQRKGVAFANPRRKNHLQPQDCNLQKGNEVAKAAWLVKEQMGLTQCFGIQRSSLSSPMI